MVENLDSTPVIASLERLVREGRARGVRVTSAVAVNTSSARSANSRVTVFVDRGSAVRPMSEANSQDLGTLARSGRSAGVRVIHLSGTV